MAGDGTGGHAPSRGRVLFVTSNFPRWQGDSTTPFVLHLARDLRALGWDVDVLAPHAPGARRREVLDGVPVERFRYLWPDALQTVCYDGGALVKLEREPWNLLKIPALVLAEWLAVSWRLATRRYALVHSHWILPQTFTCTLAAALLRIPHVATVHGGDAFALRGRVLSRFKRMALGGADRITVNSSATLAAVAPLCHESARLVRIPMGATVVAGSAARQHELRRRYRDGDGPLVVFIGRLVPEKGADDVIEAVAIIRERLPSARLLIIGDGPERAHLEARAATTGVAERTQFLGWIQPDDVHDHVAAADVFVGPSKMAANGWIEAQGLTFAEALLAGTPVVATRIGGIVDAIRHEDTGLLVEPGRPDQIAAAIVRLCADPELRSRLVRTGRDLASAHLTRPACAAAFSKLYAGVMASGTPSGTTGRS